jgi:hypothetical protein
LGPLAGDDVVTTADAPVSFADLVEAAGGDDVIFGRIADGEPVGKVMRGFNRSRYTWHRWIKDGGEERKAKYDEALRLSADALADKAIDAVEDPKAAETTAAASITRTKVNAYQWMAAKRHPDTYGDRAGVQVNVGVSIQELHLDSLRHYGRMELNPHKEKAALPPAPPAALPADFAE